MATLHPHHLSHHCNLITFLTHSANSYTELMFYDWVVSGLTVIETRLKDNETGISEIMKPALPQPNSVEAHEPDILIE